VKQNPDTGVALKSMFPQEINSISPTQEDYGTTEAMLKEHISTYIILGLCLSVG